MAPPQRVGEAQAVERRERLEEVLGQQRVGLRVVLVLGRPSRCRSSRRRRSRPTGSGRRRSAGSSGTGCRCRRRPAGPCQPIDVALLGRQRLGHQDVVPDRDDVRADPAHAATGTRSWPARPARPAPSRTPSRGRRRGPACCRDVTWVRLVDPDAERSTRPRRRPQTSLAGWTRARAGPVEQAGVDRSASRPAPHGVRRPGARPARRSALPPRRRAPAGPPPATAPWPRRARRCARTPRRCRSGRSVASMPSRFSSSEPQQASASRRANRARPLADAVGQRRRAEPAVAAGGGPARPRGPPARRRRDPGRAPWPAARSTARCSRRRRRPGRRPSCPTSAPTAAGRAGSASQYDPGCASARAARMRASRHEARRLDRRNARTCAPPTAISETQEHDGADDVDLDRRRRVWRRPRRTSGRSPCSGSR